MINAVTEAIADALYTEFGDGYKIYAEKTPQGLIEPCFFIQCISPSHEKLVGRRYIRKSMFAVQYFPSDHDGERYECEDAAERMRFALEWISVKWDSETGDPVMGTAMRHEISDGVLTFFVNYDIVIRVGQDAAEMETLKIETGARRREGRGVL